MDVKAACIADIESVARAEYGEPAIAACMATLDERLRKFSGGPILLDQIEQLLKAGNAERAVRLLTETPLRRFEPWVPLVIATVVLCVGSPLYFFGPGRSAKPAAAPVATIPDRPWPPPEMVAVQDLAIAFVRELATGRFADAHARLSAPYRRQFTVKTLATSARHPYLQADAQVQLRRLHMIGGTAQGEGTLQTGAGSVTLLVDCSLEGDAWKLTGLRLGGVEVLRQP
jgi:hypothetical protein